MSKELGAGAQLAGYPGGILTGQALRSNLDTEQGETSAARRGSFRRYDRQVVEWRVG